MAPVRCILGKFLGVVAIAFPRVTVYCFNITNRGTTRGEIEMVNSLLLKFDLARYTFKNS